MECHLPYGITRCSLPPVTVERTPPQPDRPLLDLPTSEERKAGLTLVNIDYVPRWFNCLVHRQSPIQVVTTS